MIKKSATISIDDFYLTHDDQAKLRENNPGNALLEFYGNAGSHDLSLSLETLTAIGKLTKEAINEGFYSKRLICSFLTTNSFLLSVQLACMHTTS
ncbi:putative glycerate 3-kinase [Helianthus annuus]|nr:putative glycerate 3-kinase [Helianthus annuus]KAJ0767458.1 putative glycerate 3-kinase [Helianthus annuus]